MQSQQIFWLATVGIAQLLLITLTTSLLPWQCDNEPACTITACWNWTIIYFIINICVLVSVTCLNIFNQICLLANDYKTTNTVPISLLELFRILLGFIIFYWLISLFSELFLLRNLMFNTAHRISCLCECIKKGHLPSTMPILCLLLFLQSHSLCSLSFVSVHLFWFNSSIHQVVWIPFHCLLYFWKFFFQFCGGFLTLCSGLFPAASCSLISSVHFID